MSLVTTNLAHCTHATAHSTTRSFSHSSPDRNLLNSDPNHHSHSRPRRSGRVPVPAPNSYPFSASAVSPSSSLCSSFYSLKTIQATTRRFVGLSEKEREASMRSQSNYYGNSPVQRNVTGSPAPVTVTRCFQKGYSVRSIVLGYVLLDVHLTDTRPQSTPTSPSLTQAPSAAPVPPNEADHALTCAYHLPSFPICPLDIALSHCFSACSDDARLRCTRVDAFIAGIAVSTSGHHFPSLQPPPAVHYYLSTVDDRIKLVAEQVERVYNASYAQRSSNPNPSHTSKAATTVAQSDVARLLSQPCSRSSSAATTPLHSPSSLE